MQPFSYHRLVANDAAQRRADGAGTAWIAGGTDMVQLMQEGVATPTAVIDVRSALPIGVTAGLDGIRIGAATRLSDVASDPAVTGKLPLIAAALAETASPQIRNMATVGGNLLQRTRCLYFRDTTTPCNKREPGSGCPAQHGENRINAILGGSQSCIAVNPSDLAVALAALDAEITVDGPRGGRTLRVEDVYRLPADTPHVETNLDPGDLITEVFVPREAEALTQSYVKVRDRGSFEWALVSVAVGLAVVEGRIERARVAVGGVATRPWRLRGVENALIGRDFGETTLRRAAARAVEGTDPRPGNAFKVPMLDAAVTRSLLAFGGYA